MHIIVFVKLNFHKGGGGLSTAIVRYERRNHFSLFGVPEHAFLSLLDQRSFLRHVTKLMHVSITQSMNTYETINSDKLDLNEISLPLLAEARTPTTVLIKGTTLTPATVANITFNNIHQACVHHFYL